MTFRIDPPRLAISLSVGVVDHPTTVIASDMFGPIVRHPFRALSGVCILRSPGWPQHCANLRQRRIPGLSGEWQAELFGKPIGIGDLLTTIKARPQER
jgi:hypothetical protein